ncbi:isocitrate lyase/phosphoenolpyruvate mutase family protein [Iamia sp. SCSIO 61187]|uniref:isocitrate lyase/PEP mutase family protein n=1 Tax=Iamia sp. SCSIO 61187 TaxID=2722752 RepID=UPI001C630153|nr:isocitrate lyase/phosphoenolpyruvate mutase family protein [Iamia sp. SCSIO 61187]QYG93354.1 isocitrate lyase/phosphoenolpyruvate mutase family protein [Iamia sp. SCSIO 61187]
MDLTARRDRLRELHREGTFVIPNPFDRGSARILARLGFEALATTSAGLANSRGLMDMAIDRDILLAHVADLAPATDLPLHVDAERCFADDPAGVAETVRLLGEAGAAGCSIEDWDPAADAFTPLPEAVARVEAAAGAASDAGMVLTARCEHHLHGVDDLDATVERLVAYRDAGADVVYAPGLLDAAQVTRIVAETATAVNCILLAGGLSVPEMAAAGVRRVSLGSGLSSAAYGAVATGAQHVLDHGVLDPGLPRLPHAVAAAAFGRS